MLEDYRDRSFQITILSYNLPPPNT
jgi:hypothetical protein